LYFKDPKRFADELSVCPPRSRWWHPI